MHLLDLKDSKLVKTTYNYDEVQITEISGSNIDYADFYSDFICLNKPCIIKNVTENWPCQRLWVKDGIPNVDYLKAKYGKSNVPVANCGDRYFNAHSKSKMTLNDYISYWKEYIKVYPSNKPCLYLKDWHFQKQYPDEAIYEVPHVFASDWLNEYLISTLDISDDYRFVYMGPKRSWTPVHSDILSSFSWSVNLCGKKKWVFFPPGQEACLKDKFGKLVYSLDSPELQDESKYPNYNESVQPKIVIQGVGDAIFVPSGWHHQVWNLEDTISINHNWVNAANIQLTWEYMNKSLEEVSAEITDCRGMEGWAEHVQIVLKAVHGMDMPDFANLLLYISKRRIEDLKNENNTVIQYMPNYCFGKNHLLVDALAAKNVIHSLLAVDLPCLSEFTDELNSALELVELHLE